eukprot:195147_1
MVFLMEHIMRHHLELSPQMEHTTHVINDYTIGYIINDKDVHIFTHFKNTKCSIETGEPLPHQLSDTYHSIKLIFTNGLCLENGQQIFSHLQWFCVDKDHISFGDNNYEGIHIKCNILEMDDEAMIFAYKNRIRIDCNILNVYSKAKVIAEDDIILKCPVTFFCNDAVKYAFYPSIRNGIRDGIIHTDLNPTSLIN